MSDTDNKVTNEGYLLALLAMYIWVSSSNTLVRRPMEQIGIQWVERTLENSDDCYNMFRMRCTVFRRLHDSLVNDYDLIASQGVSMKEAFAISFGHVVDCRRSDNLGTSFGILWNHKSQV